MKKALLVCGLVAAVTMNNAAAQTDTKAKAVLEAVTKKVNSLKSLKANFELKLTGGKGGKVTDSKKGTISLKGQKYHVQLSGQEILCDTKSVWTYNVDAKEVTLTNYNPADQGISPAKLLTNFYDKEYKYKYIGERKEAGKAVDVVELVPTDKAKQVSKVELLVDKASSMIVGGNIWSKNGNKTQYVISKIVPNAPIADNYFVWDQKAHPGVELNDVR